MLIYSPNYTNPPTEKSQEKEDRPVLRCQIFITSTTFQEPKMSINKKPQRNSSLNSFKITKADR